MDYPDNLKYSKEHEWVKVDGDIATVGITDYAQGELGDVVFVELPKPATAMPRMILSEQLRQLRLLVKCMCRSPVKSLKSTPLWRMKPVWLTVHPTARAG